VCRSRRQLLRRRPDGAAVRTTSKARERRDARQGRLGACRVEPDAFHRVALEVHDRAVDDLGVRVERVDRALVHEPLKVLLAALVHVRAADDGPERALRRQARGARRRDSKRRRRVVRKVREEVEQLWEVRAELQDRGRYAVRGRVPVRTQARAARDNLCRPCALLRVVLHVREGP
jgi:hypothetical protein